jgi:hypothetical protein
MKKNTLTTSSFADLDFKIKHTQSLQQQVDFTTKVPLYPNAVNSVINAHGKFYGLRSKYDGRGKLREPVKASIHA